MADEPEPRLNNRPEYLNYTTAARLVIMSAVLLGTLLEVLDVSIVNVAIPDMMGNLGATLDEIGWVSTGYIIANVIILPLTGWLSSHFGRRRYLAGSIILFTTASFFCGNAHTLYELIFFRVLQGAGGAALLSTAQATMIEIFPPNQVPMVQAIFGIGIMVAPTLGPTLGGWITDNYTWRWIFFVNIPTGTMAAILTTLFVKDSAYQRRSGARADWIGIAFLAIGLGSLQTVLERGERLDWLESHLIVVLIITSIVFLIIFVIWELRVEHPAVHLNVLQDRGLAAGSLYALVLGFGLYGAVFILPVFLQTIQGFSAEETGLILFPGGLATAIALPIVGKLLGRFAPRNLALIGAFGVVVAMLMLAAITPLTGPSQMLWALIVRGASMGFLYTPLVIASLLDLPEQQIASGTGLFNLARQLGGSMGIAFLATLLDRREAYHRAVLVSYINPQSSNFFTRFGGIAQHLYFAGGAPMPLTGSNPLAAFYGYIYPHTGSGVSHTAPQQAYLILDHLVQQQAAVLSFADAFWVMAMISLFAMPLLLLFKKGHPAKMRSGMIE
ncbi:MAG: DHA2 family efflux MFS transporter permease subunit [Armatimonadetes bacterium]|nr:DHA2 family efflux MFS transporter permease subunit [Armatimonadota bacterium]